MKTIHEYNEFTSAHNMDLEILGEVFDEPAKKSGAHICYTSVTVINCDSKEEVNKFWFEKQNSEEELKDLVKGIKGNDKYLKPIQ